MLQLKATVGILLRRSKCYSWNSVEADINVIVGIISKMLI